MMVNPLYLKKFRQQTGLKQKQFALSAGISQQALSAYELGKRELTLDKYREIKEAFGYLKESDESRLTIMVDYVRITVKSVRDLEFFCRRYLHCLFKEFVSQESKLMNYNHLWKRGDIWIFDFFDKHDTNNFQITLQLSGQGCRQFELVLERDGLTWFDFFTDLLRAYGDDVNITRFDIAVDELYRGYGHENEQFQLQDLIAKYYKKELHFDNLRSWNYIGGGSLDFDTEEDLVENRQGISLYFGSRQSEMYFNFYEKRYEYAKQEGISLEESLEVFGVWNRYEIRLSQKKANGVIQEYIAGVPLGEIAKGLITGNMQVYDGLNPYGAYLADYKWQLLFGGTEPLKLVTKPEEYNIDRTIRWLMYQVSDSLALVDEYDRITNEEYLKMIMNFGEVNERGEKILDTVRNQRSGGVACLQENV